MRKSFFTTQHTSPCIGIISLLTYFFCRAPVEVPQSGSSISSPLRSSPSPPRDDESRPLSPIPEGSAAAPGSAVPPSEGRDLGSGGVGSAEATASVTSELPQPATTKSTATPVLVAAPAPATEPAPVPAPKKPTAAPAPATKAPVPSSSASSESSQARRGPTPAASKGKSTVVTSSQQAKGKSTSVEAGQRTLSSMLPKKSPAATDPPAEPADSQQMVLHTSLALALIERKEAHAKGLVAPHMPTGERYPPSLIEFVMN